MIQFKRVATLIAILLFPFGARAQSQEARTVVEALKQGGYVVVMRHAHSPKAPPSAADAQSDNPQRERQLDTAGRVGAEKFGDSFRHLKIPIGEVLTSPTFRARQTVEYARLPASVQVAELGDGGQSMQGVSAAQTEFLRNRAAQRPEWGNTLIVTHKPNLLQAFPEWGGDLDDGDCAVLLSKNGRSVLVGRIRIDEWPALAASEPRS